MATQKPVPKDLLERISKALTVPPNIAESKSEKLLDVLAEQIGQQVQDFLAQKMATSYMKSPEDGSHDFVLDYLCDQFGLKKPGGR